jgi:NAD(P)-dependent dehydrogenase (short-subunit alcohol dehydrogenase family)
MRETFRPPQGPCFSDLRMQTALVTGGGAGIGRGICLRLATEGMHVFFCGRTEATLRETAELIAAAGGRCTPIVADVSQVESVSNLFTAMKRESQTLDVLVHNAALIRHRPLMETDVELWRQVYGANVDGAFYLAKKAAELMVPRGSGSIIFISTIGSVRAHHGMPAYDSSKGAVNSLARSLALDLSEHGIRVNAVAPGSIPTARPSAGSESPRKRLSDLAFREEIPFAEFSQQYIPLGRHGTPAEIAAAVAFLASNQASYITGQVLCVDGGATAQLSPRGIWI